MMIANIIGARPNLIKIAPIVEEFRKNPYLEPVLIHTGQHYDDRMSEIFFRELNIPAPDYNLGIGSGTHTWQTAQVMLALEPLLAELKPTCVVVVGDVNSTFAAALVAAKAGIPVAHVEAGLRSFDRTMPEELNRRLTDAISDYLFTTSGDANENLGREGISKDKVFFVGNVMIDTLLKNRSRIEAMQAPGRYGFTPRDYALLTLHRPSNVDSLENFSGILDALEKIQSSLPILFPIHPRTQKQVEEFGLLERVRGMEGIKLVQPLGYLEFLSLMSQARVVMTDSGGIQEEATILNVPCITLRENTERPITISQGTNELVGKSPERIVAAVERVLNGNRRDMGHPELWDGHAAERIVAILREKLGG
jgi:UDP-N-acetylglucosamine 2-epimerase (non-hydrolysing)